LLVAVAAVAAAVAAAAAAAVAARGPMWKEEVEEGRDHVVCYYSPCLSMIEKVRQRQTRTVRMSRRQRGKGGWR